MFNRVANRGYLVALTLLSLFTLCRVAMGQDVDTAKKALAATIRPLKLVPILIAENQRPGDVYRFLTWTLKSRRDECFSNLPPDGPSDSHLLNSIKISDVSGNAALGWFTASASASGKLQNVAVITFAEERSYVLSQKALQDHLLSSCPELTPIVNEQSVPVSSPQDLQKKAPLLAVLGRVIYAKRRIFIGVTSAADAKVQATALPALLGSTAAAASIKPLDASASISLGLGNQSGVIIEDLNPIPVAFGPAFLPDILLTTDLGGQPKPSSVHWSSADDNEYDAKRRFDKLFDLEYNKP